MQTIYTDITVLIDLPILTGIQRVTIELLSRLIKDYSDEFEVILLHYDQKKNYYSIVSSDDFFGKYVYKYKKAKIHRNKHISINEMKSEAIFLDIDSAWMSTVKRSWLLPQLKNRGIIIISHIYDLIPINYPQFCHEQTTFNFMDYITAHLLYADYFIANAEATIEDIRVLADKLHLPTPKGFVMPLGADFAGIKEYNVNEVSPDIAKLSSTKYILMVGTIEPRKNHKLLLETFEKYLSSNNVNIVFAGRPGWHMDKFINNLKTHPDFNKKIFWFDKASDLDINFLYTHAYYVAFLSYIEGFGLPIIEAIQHKAPVIASNERVNIEIGKDNCFYIPQDNPEELAKVILSSLDHPSKRDDLVSRISTYKTTTWDECACCFVDIIKKISTC